MIHNLNVDTNSPKNSSIYIKWCSLSSPRPTKGIKNVFYIDSNRKIISIWDDTNNKYINFYGDNKSTNITTNIPIKKSNNDESSLYSFNLMNDNLIITDSKGVIIEIPIPNKEFVDNKIKSLEERIEKLEELLN